MRTPEVSVGGDTLRGDFQSGAAPGVLGVPACALRDRRVRLEDLWPGTTLAERIAEAPDPAAALTAAVASRATQPDLALGAVPAHLRTGSSPDFRRS